jgi:hypothetical protein
MGRKPQVVVVERTHGMRGFPDGARSSRGRASTKMKACRAAALATALLPRAGTIKSITFSTNSQLIAHRITGAVGKFIFPKRPKGKRLVSVRARDQRGSSIHTRLGFMQRRLVKIEIISDTI